MERMERGAMQARGGERVALVQRWLYALDGSCDDTTLDRVWLGRRTCRTKAAAGDELVSANSSQDSGAAAGEEVSEDKSAAGDVAASEADDVSTVDPATETSNQREILQFFDPDTADRSTDPAFPPLVRRGTTVGFRAVFLRSRAVELLVASMLIECPEQEEEALLARLLELSLVVPEDKAVAITQGIVRLARVVGEEDEAVMVDRQTLLQIATESISPLKVNTAEETWQDDVERFIHVVERMAQESSKEQGGKEDLAEPAAQELPPSAQVLRACTQLREKVNSMNCARSDSVLLERAEAREGKLKELDTELKAAKTALMQDFEDSQKHKREAAEYAKNKLDEIEALEKQYTAQRGDLEGRREKLVKELQELDLQLNDVVEKERAHSEEKNAFQEANKSLLTALAEKESVRASQLRLNETETEAIVEWTHFTKEMNGFQADVIEKRSHKNGQKQTQANAVMLTLFETHLQHCCTTIELLWKRLQFCTEELAMMSKKQAHMQELGMESMVSDLTSGKLKLEDKYLEAEDHILVLLAGVQSVRELVTSIFADVGEENAAACQSIRTSLEFLSERKATFEARARPSIEEREDDIVVVEKDLEMFSTPIGASQRVLETFANPADDEDPFPNAPPPDEHRPASAAPDSLAVPAEPEGQVPEEPVTPTKEEEAQGPMPQTQEPEESVNASTNVVIEPSKEDENLCRGVEGTPSSAKKKKRKKKKGKSEDPPAASPSPTAASPGVDVAEEPKPSGMDSSLDEKQVETSLDDSFLNTSDDVNVSNLEMTEDDSKWLEGKPDRPRTTRLQRLSLLIGCLQST
eukprot:scaffold2398_cov339-Prasinococcus_capsulatus_cf.AAC.2